MDTCLKSVPTLSQKELIVLVDLALTPSLAKLSHSKDEKKIPKVKAATEKEQKEAKNNIGDTSKVF